MKQSLILKETFETTPAVLYHAWLNSDSHSKMTGGEATCSDTIGASFSTWDGYITGVNIELVKNQLIVQSWRTIEFMNEDEDSILTIELVAISDVKTELTLTHQNIPQGQTQYRQGWIDHYFMPMKDFFG